MTLTPLDSPGKGAFNHHISTFLFMKLNQLGIPTQFVRSLNMREHLMHEGTPLPFDVHVRCISGKKMAQDFGISEEEVFAPPLIEYIPKNKSLRYTFNEDFLMVLDWVTQEDLEEIKELATYATHVIQGLLVSFDLSLVEISLSMSYDLSDSISISGHLFPDFFCVLDLDSHDYLGIPYTASLSDPHDFNLQGHQKIAHRLGLYSPSAACTHPVSPTFLRIV